MGPTEAIAEQQAHAPLWAPACLTTPSDRAWAWRTGPASPRSPPATCATGSSSTDGLLSTRSFRRARRRGIPEQVPPPSRQPTASDQQIRPCQHREPATIVDRSPRPSGIHLLQHTSLELWGDELARVRSRPAAGVVDRHHHPPPLADTPIWVRLPDRQQTLGTALICVKGVNAVASPPGLMRTPAWPTGSGWSSSAPEGSQARRERMRTRLQTVSSSALEGSQQERPSPKGRPPARRGGRGRH